MIENFARCIEVLFIGFYPYLVDFIQVNFFILASFYDPRHPRLALLDLLLLHGLFLLYKGLPKADDLAVEHLAITEGQGLHALGVTLAHVEHAQPLLELLPLSGLALVPGAA